LADYRGTLTKIRELLEEKRSSGVSVDEALLLTEQGITAFISMVDTDLVLERESCGTGQHLKRLLNELLVVSPVTKSCQEFLKEQAFVFYKFGCSTTTVLGTLTLENECGFGPFEQSDFAGYEKNLLLSNAEAISSPGVLSAEAPKILRWIEAWVGKYGRDKELEELKNRMMMFV